MPPEVKTSGFQKDKSTKGTHEKQAVSVFNPFSGFGFSAAGGFNLWRRKLPVKVDSGVRAEETAGD
jgi:hypothetical protein